MGRKLMRVPLDFTWDTNKIWEGYRNPYYEYKIKCEHCDGSGLNEKTREIDDAWYGYHLPDDFVYVDDTKTRRYNNNAWCNHITEVEIKALLENDRLWDFTRVPINDEQRQIVAKKIASGENKWLPFNNGYIPTPEEVNQWNRNCIGHDSCNRWICVKARAENLGVYGECEHCKGEGEVWENTGYQYLRDNWVQIEPPTGDGYQLWETTSEGSPESPVFETLEALCEWCEDNATTFSDYKATKEEWIRMLSDDMVVHKEGNIVFL